MQERAPPGLLPAGRRGRAAVRYPKGHKQRTRAQILDAAARAFRAEGVAEVSIGALMRRLGLTHGGFYTHFSSKDALVAESCIRALAQAADTFFPLDSSTDPEQRLAQAIRGYLSRGHRDTPDTGCLLPALAGEVVHESDEVRRGFTEALRRYVERITTVMPAAEEYSPVSSPSNRGDHERSLPRGQPGGREYRERGSGASVPLPGSREVSEQNGAISPASGNQGKAAHGDRGRTAAAAASTTATLDRALVLVAGMAGAVLLARAVDDAELSDRLLLAARRFYTDTFAPSSTADTERTTPA